MKPNLLTTFILVALILFTQTCLGQLFITLNDYTGNWETSSSWQDGSLPAPSPAGINDNIRLYGYITANTSLDFAANNEDKSIIIYDTLVIRGDMHFNNKAMELVVEAGGLLVVFGDFSATNKISIENGGTVVVTENMIFSDSGHDTFENTGTGNLYVGGTVSGNPAASSAQEDPDDLGGSSDPGEQALYSFIAGGGDTPLPITLSYFSGTLQHTKIELEWQTLSEENFDYFEVQRSTEGTNFRVIGTVSGNGFTSDPHNYTFIDASPAFGFNYYRLRAVDFDGSSEIFHVINIENVPNFSDVRLFPNPNNGLSISLYIPEGLLSDSALSLTISDLNGRIIFSHEVASGAVLASFKNKLPEGMYIASLTANRYVHTMSVVVQ